MDFYSVETVKAFEENYPGYMAKYGELLLFLFDPIPFAALINKGAINSTGVASLVLRTLLSRLQLR